MPTGSVVLITGASTGFGRAAAEALAARGHRVFAGMRDLKHRNRAHAEALRSEARREHWALELLELDVTQEASVEAAVRELLRRTGRIDVAVNNAGIAALGMTETFTVEQFQQLFDVNFFGVIRVNRAVLPTMRRQHSGLLIHVSSGAGRIAFPCQAAYCASKFALEALADAYRFELAPFGVDSVLVEPGIHRTPIFDRFLGPADEERIADYGAEARYAERIRDRFDAVVQSSDTPDVSPVVATFVQLIESPPGERPLRTLPTPSSRPLLEPYNAMAAQLRTLVATRLFNLPELLALRR